MVMLCIDLLGASRRRVVKMNHFTLHVDEEVGAGSGDDYLKVDSAWHGDIDSDADSVDSEEEDPLK